MTPIARTITAAANATHSSVTRPSSSRRKRAKLAATLLKFRSLIFVPLTQEKTMRLVPNSVRRDTHQRSAYRRLHWHNDSEVLNPAAARVLSKRYRGDDGNVILSDWLPTPIAFEQFLKLNQ